MINDSTLPMEGFPPNLLRKSYDEKINFVVEYFVDHQISREVEKKIMSTILSKSDISIIPVMGPTRIGKTTVLDFIENTILKRNELEMEADQSYMPVIRQTASANETGFFDFKDHYIRLLNVIKEPLIYKSVKVTDETYENLKMDRYGLPGNVERNTLRVYRSRLESCFIHRRTQVYVIDEAPDMATASKRNRVKDTMQVIKSICENTGVKIILSGTYDLTTMLYRSGQLAARSCKPIHFRPYSHGSLSTEDYENFLAILRTYEVIMPLEKEPDFVNLYDYFWEKTLGCMGILKNWLILAYEETLKNKNKTILEKTLKICEPDHSTLITLIREIKSGEQFLHENDHKSIWTEMGINLQQNQSILPGKKRHSKRKPGIRNPERDPVSSNR